MIAPRSYPYTADDLRMIADRMDEIEKAIEGGFSAVEDGSWKWGLSVDVFIDTSEALAGQLRTDGDGWIGFYPYEIASEEGA